MPEAQTQQKQNPQELSTRITAENGNFDIKTHHWDRRGRLVAKNPYRLHIKEGTQYFERPVGSGNLFFEGGQPAGRVIVEMSNDGTIQTKKFDFKAPHRAYTAPLTGDEKLRHENETLKAELEAIKAEQAKKALPQENAGEALAKTLTPAAMEQKAPAPDEAKAVTSEAELAKTPAGKPITNYKDAL